MEDRPSGADLDHVVDGEELLAADVADSAVDTTRRKVESYPGVTVTRLQVPHEWPDGAFDLIVLSEVAYYLDRRDLHTLAERVAQSLSADGALVAVHWQHPVGQYPLGGDEVHAVLRDTTPFTALAHHDEPDFQLDVLVREPVVSVAEAEGLVRP